LEGLDKQSALKAIPPINDILDRPETIELIERFGRAHVIESIKLVIDEYRKNIDKGTQPGTHKQYGTRKEVTGYLVSRLAAWIEQQRSPELEKVINATGIVLHTNLGRAPLPEQAVKSICGVCEGYSNLEFDLETGGRGSRHSHIEPLITRLTGAESAIIVNNNAAAVFLCLNTLAINREVIVSRGQQVEIGGSFRIPDILSQSGVKMVEVGTTNKTRRSDYSNAITSDTEVLLKVHTSNYKVTGFTEEVSLREMAELGSEKGITVMEDLGSGSLYDLSLLGLPYEPTVQDSIKMGADLVTFSGDKLLGGPQAGIIAGRRDLIERIKKNPLFRMVRCDKTTIAAMTAVLELYMNPEKAAEKIPVLKMMALKKHELTDYAIELGNMINTVLKGKCKTEIIDDSDEIGGGSLPGVILDGKAVAVAVENLSVNEIQTGLRKAKVPVISRINKDRVL
jgi:L-seryl-tRNA(Ser) seleniumtransferase